MSKDEQSQYDAALRRKKHADEVRTQVTCTYITHNIVTLCNNDVM